jgi:hypothetical protein
MKIWRGRVRKICERVEVAGLKLLLLAGRVQTVVGVLADRLQPGVACAAILLVGEHQRRIHQPQQAERNSLWRHWPVGAHGFG